MNITEYPVNLFEHLKSNPQYILLALAGYLALKLLSLILLPTYKVHTEDDDARHSVNRLRRNGNIPPPFPKYGWYCLAWSRELPKAGSKLRVDCLGKNLLLIRDKSGIVSCIDTYCPHLGADLSDGVVKECNGETSVECPFHGWTFSAKGQCVHVPNMDVATSPSMQAVKVHSYTVVEQNNMILMWNDDKPPSYQSAVIPGLSNGQMRFHGVAEHNVPCHIQEIPENGADVEHLTYLHTPMFGPFEYGWTLVDWKVNPDKPQSTCITLKLRMRAFGKKIPYAWIYSTINQDGPALVYLNLKMCVGNLMAVQTVLPRKPLVQKVTHSIFSDWWIPRVVGKLFLWGLENQLRRDLNIWCAKTYIDKPPLAKNEGNILKFRRWYKQFYGEESSGVGNLRIENSKEW